MNENEIKAEEKELSAAEAAEEKTEAAPVISDEAEDVSAEEKTDDAEENADGGEEENADVSADENADETVDEVVGDEADDIAAPLDDAARLAAVTDPMFPTFAKGKSGTLDGIISDFLIMTSKGGAPKRSPMTLATPVGAAASPDYALSERQRRIAQSAGMSYREYYNFLKSMK